MKVLFAGGGTGGHLMPALALAEALVDARPDAEAVLVGAERGIEAQVLPKYPFRHVLLPMEPIYRQAWWRNARWPLLAWRLWREIGALLDAERPALVVGTGGYASGPVVWCAQRRRMMTALQEQNAYPGITTRWLAHRARQIHLGFPEARARLRPGPDTEVFELGNPIRPPQPGDRAEAARSLGLDPARRTALVFGGSQGARAINYAVAGVIEHRLLPDVNLLWGTGAANLAGLAGYAKPGQVVVQGFFDPMTAAYRAADLVVCRAGAVTVAELCAWGKASVLIPLPTAAADHQTNNAVALEAAGAAVVVAESTLTAHSLARAITELLATPNRIASIALAARGRGHPNAARDVVSHLLTLVV